MFGTNGNMPFFKVKFRELHAAQIISLAPCTNRVIKAYIYFSRVKTKTCAEIFHHAFLYRPKPQKSPVLFIR